MRCPSSPERAALSRVGRAALTPGLAGAHCRSPDLPACRLGDVTLFEFDDELLAKMVANLAAHGMMLADLASSACLSPRNPRGPGRTPAPALGCRTRRLSCRGGRGTDMSVS